ncbi:TPA: hypothetical protein N0F65_005060 [Lagenidium giganteum]|uniref:Elicitin-like protein n=1 Tax=Lagenidium giganteum TaxID=4803 RepID=A0AAV2ZRH6_9STRA|nr:TPA: hypothetical protein N0F65_005060 [Lagenidium giganteum]
MQRKRCPTAKKGRALLVLAVLVVALQLAAVDHCRADSSLPSSSEVSNLLAQIGPVPCSDDAVVTINKVFGNNQLLVDGCYNDTGYSVFPLSGTLPSQEQTMRMCASPACTDLLSGVVLAKLPECQYQNGSARSLAETFFRIRVDLANHRTSPKPEEFSQLYNLNMLVNEVVQNATLTTTMKSQISAASIKDQMNPAEINPDVVLSDNYVFYVNNNRKASDKRTGVSPTDSGKDNMTGEEGRVMDDDVHTTVTVSADNLVEVYAYIAVVWVCMNISYFWLTHCGDPAVGTDKL